MTAQDPEGVLVPRPERSEGPGDQSGDARIMAMRKLFEDNPELLYCFEVDCSYSYDGGGHCEFDSVYADPQECLKAVERFCREKHRNANDYVVYLYIRIPDTHNLVHMHYESWYLYRGKVKKEESKRPGVFEVDYYLDKVKHREYQISAPFSW